MENRWEDFWKSGRVEDYLGYCQNADACSRAGCMSDVLAADDCRRKNQVTSSFEKSNFQRVHE